MTDQTADDADNIFFGISRLHERGHGDGFEKLLSEQHWCCGRGQGEAGTSMSIDPVWGHDGVARSRPTMVATGAGEVHHWGRRRVAHQVAHVPNMYQRYKLAFSELNREYDVTKYRDFPRVRAFEVKGWMSLSCTFVAPYYLTFSGPCPPHFGGAPAIPPLSRQSGQDPLPPPPQIRRRAAPTSLQCSCATPARSDQDSTLFGHVGLRAQDCPACAISWSKR